MNYITSDISTLGFDKKSGRWIGRWGRRGGISYVVGLVATEPKWRKVTVKGVKHSYETIIKAKTSRGCKRRITEILNKFPTREAPWVCDFCDHINKDITVGKCTECLQADDDYLNRIY